MQSPWPRSAVETAALLREIDGCCYETIAEVLDLPIGTVRSRLHRARHPTRSCWRRARPRAGRRSQGQVAGAAAGGPGPGGAGHGTGTGRRPDRVVRREFLPQSGVDRATIDPDAQGNVVPGRRLDQEPHLVLPRSAGLMVVEVPRVVADLVDRRGQLARQAIVLLEVDRKVRLGPLADRREGLGVAVAVDRDPHHARPGRGERVGLGCRGLNVGGLRRAHALHRDRVAVANRDRADADATGWISRHTATLQPFEAANGVRRGKGEKGKVGKKEGKRAPAGQRVYACTRVLPLLFSTFPPFPLFLFLHTLHSAIQRHGGIQWF